MPGTPRDPLRRWLEEPADPRDALTRGEKTNATELAAEIAAARTRPDYQAAAERFAEAFRSGDMGCEVLSVNVALEDVNFRVSHGSASRVVRVVLSEVTAPEPVAHTHAMLAAVQVWAQLRTDVAEPEFRDHVTCRVEVHGTPNKIMPLTIGVPAGAIADAVDLPPVSGPIAAEPAT